MQFVRRPENEAEAALYAIALVGLAVGLVFGLWPALDLAVSGLFYDEAQRNWPWTRDPALIAAPGLVANAVLKSHWGRPRPIEVSAFGGSLEFVPWFSPFGGCDSNCSFVSGEAASAFSLLAIAIILPQRYRVPAVAAAIVYGLVVGLMRIAMGGHFLSDILFAGVFTALTIWVLHGAIFRWR
jgi:membrane-associated phospholipid phosphatase